jgi:hypothetical protein
MERFYTCFNICPLLFPTPNSQPPTLNLFGKGSVEWHDIYDNESIFTLEQTIIIVWALQTYPLAILP